MNCESSENQPKPEESRRESEHLGSLIGYEKIGKFKYQCPNCKEIFRRVDDYAFHFEKESLIEAAEQLEKNYLNADVTNLYVVLEVVKKLRKSAGID